ncbi:class I SAM-dependent methyltransferase [Kitasatospora sp. NPDC058170]|uniref:class I SAM-dependent methyltransferase n=1 Tax=Kitasatospora sp. NPDC058170 TaxID=3346364 RepID=UPI0036DE068B
MIDYNGEAGTYDVSRGGEARAAAAAEAVERLLPAGTRTLVDVACGTGIVTTRLCRPTRSVLGVDRSQGMVELASGRLPLGVVLGDAARLPIGSARTDAVVLIWLLHLLSDPAPVLAEGARVLRGGGVLVTTVDKDQAAFSIASDVAEVTAPLRRKYAPRAADGFDRVVELGAGHGLRPVGETGFAGIGQGRSPRQWRERIGAGRFPWSREARPEEIAWLCRDLASLPDQDIARPDPLYRLVALA